MDCAETIDVMGEALEGGLAPELRGGFQEHLDDCGPCRNYFDQLRLTRGALGRLPRAEAPNVRLDELIREFRDDSGRGEN